MPPRTPDPDSAAILLSTFQGERFLKRFLASLAGQSFRNCVLYWRDDGSTDSTVRLVRSASLPFPLIELPSERRMGACQSFLMLLREAVGCHGSFHFADQDDEWLSDKVEYFHEKVAAREEPILMHGRQTLIDAEGRTIALSTIPGPAGFENAAVENIVVGCTAVLNDHAARIGAMGNPAAAQMHDWWLYLTTSCFGHVVYDHEPRIRYRQHGGNVVGSPPTGLAGAIRKISRHALSRSVGASRLSDQLQDFLQIHGPAIPRDRGLLVKTLLGGKQNLLSRLRLASRPVFRRQHALDQAMLRMMIAMNRY